MVANTRANTFRDWKYEVDSLPTPPAVLTVDQMLAKMADIQRRTEAGEVVELEEFDQLLAFASGLLASMTTQLQQAIDSLNELRRLHSEGQP